MKQFFTIIGIIFFMGISGYLLINESRVHRTSQLKKRRPTHLKSIGEKLRPDVSPYDLQRNRINSESIFRFENIKTNTVYELDEYELSGVARMLGDLKRVNSPDLREDYGPSDVAGEEKKYWESND